MEDQNVASKERTCEKAYLTLNQLGVKLRVILRSSLRKRCMRGSVVKR
jgi:hypothetical protein